MGRKEDNMKVVGQGKKGKVMKKVIGKKEEIGVGIHFSQYCQPARLS